MEKIITIVCISPFLILFVGIILKNLLSIIKGIGYKKIKAKVIDSVDYGSSEWGVYFPNEYEKLKKQVNVLSKPLNVIDKISNIMEKIPLRITKNGITFYKDKGYQKEQYDDEDNKCYTLIAEYEVNGNKYYYQQTFANQAFGDPFKKMIGKQIDIKYNLKNPKSNTKVDINVKETLFLIGIIAILILILKYLIN